MSDRQLTEAEAIAFFDGRLWEPLSSRQRASFQMGQERLCIPFGVFHKAMEEALRRDVAVHEFGSAGRQRLIDELNRIVAPPTMDEILAMIPEDKRIVVVGERGDR